MATRAQGLFATRARDWLNINEVASAIRREIPPVPREQDVARSGQGTVPPSGAGCWPKAGEYLQARETEPALVLTTCLLLHRTASAVRIRLRRHAGLPR